eukprot:857758_1
MRQETSYTKHHNCINTSWRIKKTNTVIHGESCLRRASRYSSALWSKYMGDHTTGWIVRGVISETMEILIQTQALFLYNGYNMWDRHNDEIYIANQSHFIVWFAVILAFNSVGSGVLWCSYALLTKYCHGLLFKLLLFCVDEFSDLFYTLFPFLMILFDDYNHDKQNMRVLLAQLNTHSTTVAFVSAFMPLVLLGSKSLFLIRSAQTELADRYYSHWKLVYDISTQKDDKQASYQAQLAGRHVNTAALQKNKEIFDSTGNLVLTMKTVTGRRNWIQSKTKDTISRKKQCILVAIALVYMIYGVAMLSYVINHVHQAEQYCNLIEESNYFEDGELNINSTELSKQQHELLQSNPELFFWNKCLYKVYPFLGNGVKYRHACQCRVLVIDWSETMSTAYDRNTYFNLTQPIILSSMLKHWFQLEKFRTNQKELTSSLQGTPITKEMFIAKHMKAFEWTFAKIGCIAQGISEWKQLEYLKLQHASLPFGIPNDFDGLESMKYLSFEENGLPAFPDSICSLTSLEFLDIQLEANIKSIHPCISNLTQLKQLTIENCILMEEIPLSVFNLSNLVILSLFNNLISLQSLIQYNAPIDIDKNDVEWLKNELIIGSKIEEYHLAWNPICDENTTWFAAELNDSISEACHYPCEIRSKKGVFEVEDRFCSPRLLRNGRCDPLCNNGNCYSDGGDCVQLCFSPLTDCTDDLYDNDVCDDVCNNQYCMGYSDKYLTQPHLTHDGRGPDNFRCTVNYSSSESSELDNLSLSSNLTCEESNSTYTDLTHEEQICSWVGDGSCDDFCRTDECNQDAGDCDPGSCINNVCSYIHSAWLLFVSPSEFIVNISYFCETIYPNAVLIFGVDPFQDVSCYEVSLWDWNNDSFLNFREFTHVAYWFAGGSGSKGKQLNCSECIGMEHYNVNNNDLFATSKPVVTCEM